MPRAWHIAILAALALLARPASATEASKEYALKAAFLYNFTKFVTWPESCFADGDRPLLIGVVGRNPFGRDLVNAVRSRLVDGRALAVAEVRSLDEAKRVHVLFFPATEDAAVRVLIAALRDKPVLTVGETKAFREAGGMIAFVVERDKLRFAIDSRSAEEAGLRISSQLLKLARRP